MPFKLQNIKSYTLKKEKTGYAGNLFSFKCCCLIFAQRKRKTLLPRLEFFFNFIFFVFLNYCLEVRMDIYVWFRVNLKEEKYKK